MTFKPLTRTVAAAAMLGAVSLPTPALADAVSDLLNTYNVIVFGDLNSASQHVDGNALVGGNVSGGVYGMHYPAIPSAPALSVAGNLVGNVTVQGPGLNVGGNLATSNLNLNSGGDVHVGGNVTASFNINGAGNLYVSGNQTAGSNVNVNNGSAYIGGAKLGNINANGGGTVNVGSPLPAATMPDIAGEVAAAQASLTTYSSQLAALAADSMAVQEGNKLTFTANAGSDGIAVFNVTGALLSSVSEFAFSLGNAVSVVINVTGQFIDIAANFLGGAAQQLASNTIWNFTEATSLDIERQFGGSILAVYANLTNGNNIEGTVVAAALNQRGEIHYNGPAVFVAPTPIPAALPLFGAALALFAGRRMRKRT